MRSPETAPLLLWLNGVGFSYALDGNVTIDDFAVAEQNYQALLDFLSRFPELAARDFYITGESYAGVYLPTLGVKIVNDKTNFPNFKGMAIGNGVLSFTLNYQTMVPLYYYHGIVRDELYQRLSSTCCNGNIETCDILGLFNNLTCKPIISELYDAANPPLNSYNLYETCYLSDNGPTNKLSVIKRGIFHDFHRDKPKRNIKKNVQFDTPTGCIQVNNTYIYMNRQDVRKALNIPASLPIWTDCNDEVTNNYVFRYYNMTKQIEAISAAGVRILTYFGDVDTVCNDVMGAKFLTSLNKTIIGPEVVNQPWTYNGAAKYADVAGFQLKYDGGIDYLTVRGSGHFVPKDRPREALQMIYNFVNQRDYSMPVPQ
ncbi:hypothetical protein WR25_06475 [Diploscapter pachys]|uniref:Carboxypeptidase n=1 Tax=Diploscapter pachys TaxID=2018661 RepID=A0A2A2LFK2_9BILA|nr:hypothetical protein WR25_06475 [Diploscapter pachys]